MPAWSDASDRRLLMTITHLQAPATAPKWDQVAALMGDGFTAESTRQHFQKMRKECEAQFGKPGTPTGTPAPKATPRKSGGKRKKAQAEQDDEEVESPTKKQAVKAEDGDSHISS